MTDRDAEAAAERAVLADELQQRGDPQGELIALQQALEGLPDLAPPARRNSIERKIAAVLDAHHDAFYGALASHVNRLSRPDLRESAFEVRRWRCGFADEIALHATQALGLRELYRAMRVLPISRFVRKLVLGVGDHPAVVAELAADLPPTLRALVVGDRWYATSASLRVPLPDIVPVAGIAMRLEELRFEYAAAYSPFSAPVLRAATLHEPHVTEPPPMFAANAPLLEELVFWGYRVDAGLFERFPRLAHLSFGSGRGIDADFLEGLASSPHAECLRTLTVHWSFDASHLETLVRHADRFARLDRIRLIANAFDPQVRAAASARLPNLEFARG